MPFLRTQAWIPAHVWRMWFVVLPDLHIQAPVQGQHWQRGPNRGSDDQDNHGRTARPINDDHNRTDRGNRTVRGKKASYVELLSKKARDQNGAPSETARFLRAANVLDANPNESWLKRAAPLPGLAVDCRYAIRTLPPQR